MTVEATFFETIGAVRQILASHGNAPSALTSLRSHLSDPDVRREFFQSLNEPSWIGPLRAAGYFRASPEPRELADGGVQHPVWAEGQYLARMAGAAPAEVAAAFANIDTHNLSVVGNMLDAARAMPAAEAVALVPTIVQAARTGTLWIHFKDAADLCVQLAKEGEVRAARRLAAALFAPRTGEGEEQLSRRDEYWYRDGLTKVVPVLTGLEPRGFLKELCSWLDALVRAKQHLRLESGADYSYLWRPAVEEHEQNRDYDITGVVVGFLRRGLEQAIQSGDISLDGSLAMIAGYPFLIFKRIRVHLINEFADKDPQLACQTIMDRALFDDFRYKHEYAMLVGRRLGLLTFEQRETWFAWVDAGPDMAEFETRIREELGRDLTPDERVKRKEYWQFEKLHCVRTHLEGKRRDFYREMLARHGEPELADLNSRISTGWGGGGSAISVDELRRLSFDQAVERVCSWVPSQDQLMGPDVEGLASAFGEYVGTNPESFSAKALALVGRPALYVRRYISQMAEAIKARREIDVPAVLALCQWVLGRPMAERTGPDEGTGELADKSWQWTRDEISRLAQAIFEAEADGRPRYPLEVLREQMWQVVDALSRDPAGSYIVHDTSKDDPRGHDYLTQGINSPRGKAVEAALEYARWVSKHIKKIDGRVEIVPGGFDAMPEVRNLLEWQMAPENRTVEALALIGSRVGLMYWIDRDWLAANAGRLFHLHGIEELPQETQGWAAWNAFLAWVPPHIEFYRLFRDQYSFAVTQAAETDLGEASHERPMDHLGEHLMLLYGRGQLGLDEDDGLLRRFLARSNPDIRRHAIGFVGQVLDRESTLPQDFVDRYQSLWEVYWAGPGRTDAQEKPDALLFGLWFSSGRFSPQWAVPRLHEFAEVVPIPEPDHGVVNELARVASTNVLNALEVLERMVHAGQEGWRVQGWLDPAKTILELAMRAGGEARVRAERLIDHLGRRGFTSLGNLLALGDSVN